MSKKKNATIPRKNTKAPTTGQRVRDVLGGQMGFQTICEHVDDVVVQSCRSSYDFPTRKPCEQLHSSQSVSVSSSPTPLTTAHRLLANDVALSPERRMARRSSRLSWVIVVHLFFSCLSQSHAQLISTSTPVPPLQWLNITGLLQGSPAPPLKYASIGYDDTTRNLIIFGGQASSGIPTAQTFLYDIVLPPPPPLTTQQPQSRYQSMVNSYQSIRFTQNITPRKVHGYQRRRLLIQLVRSSLSITTSLISFSSQPSCPSCHRWKKWLGSSLVRRLGEFILVRLVAFPPHFLLGI